MKYAMQRSEIIKKLETKDIILFGAGNYAREFYAKHSNRIHIRYCISNDANQHVFTVGDRQICPVIHIDNMIRTDELIVVCAENRMDMENQLKEMGLDYGVDYISSVMAAAVLSDKKLALLYGVCYIRAINSCILTSDNFMSEYEPFLWLSYHEMNAVEYEEFSFVMEMCDVFIYNLRQSYRKKKENEAYLSRLKPSCMTMSVPPVSFAGYLPRTQGYVGMENAYNVTSTKGIYATFHEPDYNINRLIDEGYCLNDIKKIVSDVNFYSKSFLEDNYYRELSQAHATDEQADMHIIDYIDSNIRKKRLYLTENHVTNDLAIEYSRRILVMLGIEPDLDVDALMRTRLVNSSESPVYPSVIDKLGLTMYGNNPKYTLFTYRGDVEVTFDEYVERYYDFCSAMKRYKENGYFPW